MKLEREKKEEEWKNGCSFFFLSVSNNSFLKRLFLSFNRCYFLIRVFFFPIHSINFKIPNLLFFFSILSSSLFGLVVTTKSFIVINGLNFIHLFVFRNFKNNEIVVFVVVFKFRELYFIGLKVEITNFLDIFSYF